TGAAYIFVEETSGNNAIIVSPGAAMLISPDDIEANAGLIRSAGVFVTQLEQPIEAAMRALEIARGAGVTTILNPAPAASLPDLIYTLCDYVTPNETEAEELTGIKVSSIDDARRAADRLLEKGAGAVIVTLGEQGALLHTASRSDHVGAIHAGPVVETTGAGDAFNGGLAAALARGVDPLQAVRFACA
ncbi:MAG: ribokinase, partial [Mesorhizobium sp.]